MFWQDPPFQISVLWRFVCGVSTLLISLVEGSLFKSSLLSEVLLYCGETLQILEETFISYPNVRDEILRNVTPGAKTLGSHLKLSEKNQPPNI
jgi:chorismate-pyruvate lyase